MVHISPYKICGMHILYNHYYTTEKVYKHHPFYSEVVCIDSTIIMLEYEYITLQITPFVPFPSIF